MSEATIDLLVIEDNPGDALIVKEVLKDDTDAEYEITIAKTFAEATVALQNGNYAAALLDLSLPDATGLEMVRTAVGLASETAIIVLTGRADEALAKQSIEIGAADYLLKLHIFGPDLAIAIHAAIERHGQKQ
jgi:DNA-binding response OmpR family regulator